MTIHDKIKKFIQAQKLIKPGDHVLVGVSGGADSIALLSILQDLRTEWGMRITAAHVNHQLRSGAWQDEQFVQRLCRSLGLPCTSVRIKISPQKNKSSIEELAREQRLNALVRIARQVKADRIALAHHRDDLAETVLMRILRGTGLLGLQGILPQRTLNGITVIRPLLEITRREIESFLKQKKLRPRQDPTNQQMRFFRNKIRLKLLPLLRREYNPNLTEVLAHLAQTAAADYDFLQQQATALFPKVVRYPAGSRELVLPLKKISALHPSQQRLLLRFCFEQLKGDLRQLSAGHLQEAADLLANRPAQSVVHWPSGVRLKTSNAALTISRIKS